MCSAALMEGRYRDDGDTGKDEIGSHECRARHGAGGAGNVMIFLRAENPAKRVNIRRR